jgi:HAD superfamily phosphoserine phosphatase-like hydrolase
MTIILFDVCHTLYESNTTFDFLAAFFGEDPSYLALARKRRSWSGRVRAKFGRYEQDLRNDFVALLSGQPETYLREKAADFVSKQTQIEPTQSLLKQAQQRGDDVRLISGSLDFIVEAVANTLSVETFYASKVGFKNQICQGIITDDLDRQKAVLLEREFTHKELVMISDNFSDEPCIMLVKDFHPVYRLGDKRSERFWRTKPVARPVCYG